MIKTSVSLQETVDFLNSLLEKDPVAITALFSMRTACNKEMADHETVQVGALSKDYFQVGMIGVLNGLFGIDSNGWGHICAHYDNGSITHFEALNEEKVKSMLDK